MLRADLKHKVGKGQIVYSKLAILLSDLHKTFYDLVIKVS